MWNNLAGSLVFYIIAATAVIFSLFAVTLKNIFHSALCLVVVFLAVAAVYIYLDAEFLALAQILIYVGAIMALIIFAIMLTADIYNKKIRRHNEQKFASFLISGATAAFLIFILYQFGGQDKPVPSGPPALAALGKELLTEYALPFELISLILLAALIGAVAISRKE